MVADIVGSTPAMEADEEAGIARCNRCLDAVSKPVADRSGRVFATAGDAVLAEFSSPINALRAAIDARSEVGRLEGCGPGALRIGLHLADVVVQGDDLRGDGVNLAARIQSGAVPGAIDISGALFEQIKRNSPCVFDDLGDQVFKGISDPVRIFRVRTASDRGRYQSAPTTTALDDAQVRPSSIIVLPFTVSGSADEDQAFLADGLTDDLTLELSRMKSLFVMSRSAGVSNQLTDPVEIGRKLGVGFVLSGSIRKLGDRIRFNIALTETSKGNIIWSDRIQDDFDKVFDMMDGIASRITATVTGRVEHQAIQQARLKRPENMSAYECYLRAIHKHRMSGITDTYAHEAVEWFNRAIDLDPGFGRSYAMRVCSASYFPDFDIVAAEKDVQKALDMDPTDPEAHRIMGVIKMKLRNDYDASRYHHERAVQMAPNDAYILGRCAAFYIFVDEAERALDLLARAGELDPFLPVWVLEETCSANYTLGRYDAVLRDARSLPHQTRRTYIYKAASLVAVGQPDAARAEIELALVAAPELTTDYIIMQELFQNRRVLSELVARARQSGLPSGDLEVPSPLAAVGAG
jgi:TolB-like protein/Tfp pilus assembly protein PilF